VQIPRVVPRAAFCALLDGFPRLPNIRHGAIGVLLDRLHPPLVFGALSLDAPPLFGARVLFSHRPIVQELTAGSIDMLGVTIENTDLGKRRRPNDHGGRDHNCPQYVCSLIYFGSNLGNRPSETLTASTVPRAGS
jgi:hypothetical protein